MPAEFKKVQQEAIIREFQEKGMRVGTLEIGNEMNFNEDTRKYEWRAFVKFPNPQFKVYSHKIIDKVEFTDSKTGEITTL